MFFHLYRPNDPRLAALDLPAPIMPSLYHRYAVFAWGRNDDPDQPHAHVIMLAFRLYPMVLWQYFPRAWGMRAPAPAIDATDWTGREREFKGAKWYAWARHWTALDLRRLRVGREAADHFVERAALNPINPFDIANPTFAFYFGGDRAT